jgi:DNA-binding GntR family transcriptional regulator
MKRPHYQTKIDVVTETIRDSIINGTLRPEERIQINSLAKKLGISPIPVREAMRILEVEGFLEVKPHRGVFVRGPDVNTLPDIFEVRALLECRAARMACARITDSDVEKLGAVYLEMEKLLGQSSQSSVRKHYALNRKFHGLIYEASGRPFLCKTIEGIAMNIQPYLLKYIALPKALKEAHKDHKLILGACKERDAQLLEEAIAKHLARILGTLMKLVPQSENNL